MIQLAHPTKDGMVNLVLIFLALLVHGIMAHNVSVQTPMIDACLGNYLMDINVSIISTLAQVVLNGADNLVLQPIANAHKDFTKKELNANHSHKDACIQPLGQMIVVCQLTVHALMVQLHKEIPANPTHSAQIIKHGTQI